MRAFTLTPRSAPGALLKGQKARKPVKARVQDQEHLAFIRSLPCILTGRKAEAAHLRFGSRLHGKAITGIGTKPDDRWVLPLCHDKHMEQHASGLGEPGWWRAQGIADPLVVCMRLWEASGDRDAALRVIEDAREAGIG